VREAVRERHRERVLTDPFRASKPQRSPQSQPIPDPVLPARHQADLILGHDAHA